MCTCDGPHLCHMDQKCCLEDTAILEELPKDDTHVTSPNKYTYKKLQ